ncbi:unnamed protein product [Ixodes pacificus]
MRTWVSACLIVCGITRTLGLQGASNAWGSLRSLGSLGSAASRLNPIKNGAKAWDNTFGKLTNSSVADIARRLNENTIPGVRRRVLTDVTQGGHRMVEVFQDTTNDTVLDCNSIGDKTLIEGVLEVIPEGFINKVTQEEMQYFLDLCDGRDPNEDKGRFQSFFEFIGKIFQSLFIFPGTKWCGAGDVAKNYDDLGRNKGTDMCCRAHDHSDDYIPALKTKHGITNKNLYTMTNCEDDRQFYNCLLNDSSLSSVAVGKLFFNVLRTDCFAYTYPKKCVKKNPIPIPILSPKCKKYEIDKSAPKEWQTFSPSNFLKDYFDKKRNQTNQERPAAAENNPETDTENAGALVNTKEPEDKTAFVNENDSGNLVDASDTHPSRL